ncbi:MAG: RNA polymerase sigma factor [Verrucomicrobiota bacterium JB024]|nr:RNA polymerase sigma factor [Verrucomicrobiota bacterium JB024]
MDEDLPAIERIRQGDESGLRALMADHREAVFHFTLRYCGNEADAAELTAETFYRVYKNAARYHPRARVRTWIFTIAANLSRDFLRRQKKRRGEVSLESTATGQAQRLEDTLAGPGQSPATGAASRETVHAVQAAIQELPHKLRFPLVFCVLEENPQEECAAALGISVKAVETRIYRARKYLRERLEKI